MSICSSVARQPRSTAIALAVLLVLLGLGAGRALLPSAALAASITVDTTSDELNADGDCSLREAIQAANTDAAVDACSAGSGADAITLPPGTYTLSIAGTGEDANATGDLDITAALTISGSGAPTTVIDGADQDRVLHVVSGTVQIDDVTITNGSVGGPPGGGGIFIASGSLTLNRSAVAGNFADTGGGGIDNLGSLMVDQSTIAGNSVFFGGGGIQNHGPGATATINQSTISGNAAKGGGSGIDNLAPMTLKYSTVSNNLGYAAAGINSGATVKGTIVANNSLVTGGTLDCYGALNSLGYNLIETTTFCLILGDPTGNIIGVDPALGGLADNGGPTRTHALLPGSPAIDAGSPDCPPPATDQRGVVRPQGAACDIGAYELALVTPTPTSTATPTNTLAPTATPPRPPLGGVAAYPEIGSGHSAGVLAIVTAAAAVVALGSAAWYTRRRWSR